MTLKPPVSSNDHTAGGPNARVTLVEYGDYQCPHCANAEPVVRAVQHKLGAELAFVFRNFPLTEMHPAAEPAAELAEAAADHGKFWETHHAIFAWSRKHGPESLGAEAFEAIAKSEGLDPREMLAAVDAHKHLARVRDDFNSGVRSGVNGTPTFFIDGHRYDGMPDVDSLVSALTAAMK